MKLMNQWSSCMWYGGCGGDVLGFGQRKGRDAQWGLARFGPFGCTTQ